MDERIPEPTGNRQKLLVAALACLRDKGYAHTTARDLVAASGTNLNSIGYHFGGKEELLQEAIAVGFEAWTAQVERTTFADAEAGGAERLQKALAETVDRFAELRPFLIAFVEAFPPAVRSAELRERLARCYEDTRQAGAQMVLRAAQAERIKLSQQDAETLASVVTAICDGLMLQWLLDPDRVPDSAAIVRALAAVAPELSRRAPAAGARRARP